MKLESRKDRFGREEMIEQKFRVTKNTSFFDMKREACIFWNLDPEEFTLVLPNKHDIMSLLAGDEQHIAHTLAKYFEIHRAKRAVLHLVKPQTKRNKLHEEEKELIKIHHATQSAKRKKRKETPAEAKKRIDEHNLKVFFDKYSDLREELIEDLD